MLGGADGRGCRVRRGSLGTDAPFAGRAAWSAAFRRAGLARVSRRPASGDRRPARAADWRSRGTTGACSRRLPASRANRPDARGKERWPCRRGGGATADPGATRRSLRGIRARADRGRACRWHPACSAGPGVDAARFRHDCGEREGGVHGLAEGPANAEPGSRLRDAPAAKSRKRKEGTPAAARFRTACRGRRSRRLT